MEHHCAVALIIHEQRVLLGRRSSTRAFYPDVWDLFGGHVEPGEQPQEALIRELREELAIAATAWTYLATLAGPPGEQPASGWYHLYRVTAWQGTPTNAQPHEHSAIRWVSLSEALALELADPAYRDLLTQHLGVGPATAESSR